MFCFFLTKTQLTEIDQSISTVLGETERCKSRQQQLKQACETLRSDISSLTTRHTDAIALLQQKQALLSTANADFSNYDNKLTGLQSELGTELQSQLDQDDLDQVTFEAILCLILSTDPGML